jgi:hypothetical protein
MNLALADSLEDDGRDPDQINARAIVPLDLDDPTTSSPLALALAARDSDAVVTPDIFRADLPGIVAPSTPWITWVTAPRVAPFDQSSPNDALLLADPSFKPLATKAGWPADRLAIATWPFLGDPSSAVHKRDTPLYPKPSVLALIADTMPIDVPDKVKEFSSHRLLWEQIEQELCTDPLALSEDIAAFLSPRMKRANVSDEGFDHALFIEKLIVPAHHQGLARLLLKAGLPLVVFGAGWERLPEFRHNHGGYVTSLDELHIALRCAVGIIHPHSTPYTHAIDALGKPVLRRLNRRADAFVKEAAGILNGAAAVGISKHKPLGLASVLSLLPGRSLFDIAQTRDAVLCTGAD